MFETVQAKQLCVLHVYASLYNNTINNVQYIALLNFRLGVLATPKWYTDLIAVKLDTDLGYTFTVTTSERNNAKLNQHSPKVNLYQLVEH